MKRIAVLAALVLSAAWIQAFAAEEPVRGAS